MNFKLVTARKYIVAMVTLTWIHCVLAQTPAPGSGMMGIKIDDSEDLNDEAKTELQGANSVQDEKTDGEHKAIKPEDKPDIVIVRPPTLEDQARAVKEEIEMEKAKRMLAKTGRRSKFKEVGQVGQESDTDVLSTTGGGGGGDGGEGVEEATWFMIKPTCLKERAEMEMAEVQMAKLKPKARGQGGGEGGGSGGGTGEGSGSGVAEEMGGSDSYRRTVKKVCKSKNMYECMAQEAKERALVEEEGNGGDLGALDGSSGEAEVKFKRPPVRFKTKQELEAEAQKILKEKDTPNIGENRAGADELLPASTVTVTRPTIQENARQIQSEIESDKKSREIGSGDVKSPPSEDLE